jgi:hypothetical protein
MTELKNTKHLQSLFDARSNLHEILLVAIMVAVGAGIFSTGITTYLGSNSLTQLLIGAIIVLGAYFSF